MSASASASAGASAAVYASADVEVRRVTITRQGIDLKHPTAGAELAEALSEIMGGRPGGLPLAKERVEVELAGVPIAVASALRRVLTDELRGRCLTFEGENVDREVTTDPFMADEDFVRTRVRMIPLCPQVSDALVRDLRLALDAENKTAAVMTVYSGDLVVTAGELSKPIFNPTHELAFLQPGKTLRIRGIGIAEGIGREDAAFAVAVRGVSRPLDLEELPREATHMPNGAARQQSGFAVSTLVANPRRHLVSAVLPAVPANGGSSAAVLSDACANIMRRLRFVLKVLAAPPGAGRRAGGAYFTVDDLGDKRTKGVLGIQDETDTIGNLLSRGVYETTPGVSSVNYTCIPHEKTMKLTVVHAVSDPGEIALIMSRGAQAMYDTFDKIQQEIRAKA